jgi:thiol-disulfide isomerase/thioredoxin
MINLMNNTKSNSKKYILLALFTLMNATVFGQKQPFTVVGNFSDWKNRGPVVLHYQQNNALLSDTAEVKNGKFTFRGTLTEPTRMAVYSIASVAGKTKDNFSFYVDQGPILLKGTDSLKNAVVEGTLITREGRALDKQTTPIIGQLAAIRMKGMAMSKDASQKDQLSELNTVYRAMGDSLRTVKINFIKNHPRSYISLLTVKEFLTGVIDYGMVEPLLKGLTAELRQTPLAKDLAQQLAIAKRVSIGVVMPDFTSLDTNRKSLSLKEVVKKGKVTLVDFWASWCLPCRKENPNVVRAYQTFHDKGFNILSVSLDKSEAAWKQAINQDGMPWYHVSGLQYWNEPVAKLFGITGVPDSFLVDGEGKIIARGLRAEQLLKRLAELL